MPSNILMPLVGPRHLPPTAPWAGRSPSDSSRETAVSGDTGAASTLGAWAAKAPDALNAVPTAIKTMSGLGYAAYLKRTDAGLGITLAMHSASLVARQTIPAFVLSPVVATAVAAEKFALAVAAPALVAHLAAAANRNFREDTQSTVYNTLRVALPAMLAVTIGVASMVSFPAAEAAALALTVAAGLMQQALAPQRALARHALAAVCILAVVVGREAAFDAVGHRPVPVALSPFDTSPAACNGAVQNCAAQLCDVVFASTHLSAVRHEPFAHMPWPISEVGRFASNQGRTLQQQFADGIRGFLLEYYENDQGELRSSHNTVWDVGPLEDHLRTFNELLGGHPRDYVMLKISPQQTKFNETKLLNVIKGSGLADKTLQHGCKAATNNTALQGPNCWFSMGALLDQGIQASIFTSSLQNSFEANLLSEMRCMSPGDVEAHDSKRDVVLWNAFVSLALKSVSEVVNPQLGRFVERCTSGDGEGVKTPTMIAVNHYESSNVVQIAHALNTRVKKRSGFSLGGC